MNQNLIAEFWLNTLSCNFSFHIDRTASLLQIGTESSSLEKFQTYSICAGMFICEASESTSS
jgi:hypothetical protein